MARKISPAQLRALRDGAAHPEGRISVSAFAERTIECLVGLGYADWEARIGLPTVGVVTAAGRAYLAQLDATTAPQAAPAAVEAAVEALEDQAAPQSLQGATSDAAEAARLTADDVADAKARAIRWLNHTAARRAEGQPPSLVLAEEVARTRRVMRRALKVSGPEATMGAIRQHEDARVALLAARRIEAEAAAAAPKIMPGDLVEGTVPSSHPRTIRVRVDREPWPMGDHSTVLSNGSSVDSVYTYSLRIVERAHQGAPAAV